MVTPADSTPPVQTPAAPPPAAAPPAESAAPLPASQPAAPTADEITRLRDENARLQRQWAESQRQTEEQRQQAGAYQWAQQRARELETSEGRAPEDALKLAQAESRAYLAEYRQRIAAGEVYKSNLMDELSARYGVPKARLLPFNDEGSMRQYAQEYSTVFGPQDTRIKELERRLSELTRGQVPAQQFNQPGPTGSIGITPDNIDLLYSQGKVSDEMYRRFLDTGELG